MTTGNNDTLDKLNRGEIAMGPVWVDMLISMKNENRMDPKIKMKLIAPGFPGQPMYLVVTKKSPNYEMAKKFVEFITSPEQQARVIVERKGWLPGHRRQVRAPGGRRPRRRRCSSPTCRRNRWRRTGWRSRSSSTSRTC